MMKNNRRMLLAMLFLLPIGVLAQNHNDQQADTTMKLPRWGIKTNLLYDATATVNLGLEFRTGGRTSIDLPFNYNAWTFSENRKWKHILVQPEFRWWTKETFRGHFFGLHGHYAFYNVGTLPHPPFSEYMNAHRFEGWLAGAGLSYGYRWNFNHRWAMEATVGVGYAYLSYDIYDCVQCGEKLDSDVKHYFGPTKVGLSLIYGIGGKRASAPVYAPPVYIEPAKPKLVIPYEPKLHASFVTPEAETVKARSASGKAYLDFAVGRSEIVPGFRKNADELQKIHTLIESVKKDPDATVTGMSILGYASPEGSYASNMTLSKNRAQALKKHIISLHGLPENMFSVEGRGEDWAGLDSLINKSDMPEKYRLLEIVRGSENLDAREQKIKMSFSKMVYGRMQTEYYPQLRRSDYSINYTVIPFTVEQGKEVFKTRPDHLSLNEMFLIANTYDPGSRTFNEVFETAARIFPNSDVANINAAANALEHKDAVSAARYLERVKEQTAAYWNNMGILSWLQDDKQKAAECFSKGGAQGAGNIVELQKHIQSLSQ